MSTIITIDELYAEYEKVGLGPDKSEFKTVNELSDIWNVRIGKVRELLKYCKNENRLVLSKVTVEGIDGRKSSVPAYKILPSKKQNAPINKRQTKKK